MEIDFKADGLCIFGKDVFNDQGLLRAGRHKQDCVINVLDNRVIHLSCGWKRKLYSALSIRFINGCLKEVGCQHENEWRQRIALSDTTPAVELSARNTV